MNFPLNIWGVTTTFVWIKDCQIWSRERWRVSVLSAKPVSTNIYQTFISPAHVWPSLTSLLLIYQGMMPVFKSVLCFPLGNKNKKYFFLNSKSCVTSFPQGGKMAHEKYIVLTPSTVELFPADTMDVMGIHWWNLLFPNGQACPQQRKWKL